MNKPLSAWAPSERQKVARRARPLLVMLAKRLEIVADDITDDEALAALHDLVTHARTVTP